MPRPSAPLGALLLAGALLVAGCAREEDRRTLEPHGSPEAVVMAYFARTYANDGEGRRALGTDAWRARSTADAPGVLPGAERGERLGAWSIREQDVRGPRARVLVRASLRGPGGAERAVRLVFTLVRVDGRWCLDGLD